MTETSESADQRTPQEWDRVYDTLASHRRRRMLAFLEREGPASLADVVEGLARTGPPDDPAGTAHARHTIELSLHHVHLPKLVDTGFVGWDRETTEITLEAPPLPLADILPMRSLGSDLQGASTTE